MAEKILTHAVIVFPERGTQVLLARKMFKIGAGCWNGYGGGIEDAETPAQAAVRELREECGLETSVHALEKIALVDFHNLTEDDVAFTCTVHAFLARAWAGAPQETDEMRTPQWFRKNALPLSEMMLADQAWIPSALAGKKLIGEAWYGPHQKTLRKPTKIHYVKKFDP